jgi:hypothetical protein
MLAALLGTAVVVTIGLVAYIVYLMGGIKIEKR